MQFTDLELVLQALFLRLFGEAYSESDGSLGSGVSRNEDLHRSQAWIGTCRMHTTEPGGPTMSSSQTHTLVGWERPIATWGLNMGKTSADHTLKNQN